MNDKISSEKDDIDMNKNENLVQANSGEATNIESDNVEKNEIEE